MITQQKPIWHDLLLQPDSYVKSPNQFENSSYKQHGLYLRLYGKITGRLVFYVQRKITPLTKSGSPQLSGQMGPVSRRGGSHRSWHQCLQKDTTNQYFEGTSLQTARTTWPWVSWGPDRDGWPRKNMGEIAVHTILWNWNVQYAVQAVIAVRCSHNWKSLTSAEERFWESSFGLCVFYDLWCT